VKRYAFLTALLAAFCLLGFTRSPAEVVGRFTQVEGRVDLLKGGNLPATPVAVNATVEPQDVVRTKSLSKAQITFIDNSLLTISPRSRIAIAEYMIEPAQGKRRAVLEIFQGMALAVVNKIFNVKEPDFVVKTHTAIMGVRGTEFGVRLLPNSSTIMNFKGLLQVGNVFPEIGQLFQKAFKVAFAFGPPGNQSGHWVFLKAMQATAVARDLPPTLPYGISRQDREMFMRQLTIIAPQTSSKAFQGTDTGLTTGKPTVPETSTTPVSTTTTPAEQTGLAILNTLYVPPVVTNIVQQAPITITTYSFAQNYTGPYQLSSVAPNTVGVFTSTGQGSGTRTGVYPGNFTASYNFSGIWDSVGMKWVPSYAGTFEATMSGQVTGTLGQTLTGTMQITFTDSPSGGQFQVSGPVSISPSGEVTSHFTGTGVSYPNLDGITVTEGTITQAPITTGATDSTAPATLTAATSPSAPAASPTTVTAAETAAPAAATVASPATTTTAAPVALTTTSQVSAPQVTTQAVTATVASAPTASATPTVTATAVPVVTATATPAATPQVSPTITPVAVATVTPATAPVASATTSQAAK